MTFTAAATNPAGCMQGPTVQWMVSTDGGTTFAPIYGATSATLFARHADLGWNGYEVEAVFTNEFGSATSQPATLTVHRPPLPLPVITAVFPHHGFPGSLVAIFGKHLESVTHVAFGGQRTVYLDINDHVILALAPYGPTGTVDVTAVNATGTSATSPADQFTYRQMRRWWWWF